MWPFKKANQMNYRTIDPNFAVAGQIQPDQIGALAAAGFKSIVCARPDNEEPGQPSFRQISAEAEKLAWTLARANETFATDYPASVGSHMTNTDSTPFMDLVPSITVREAERGTQIGSGWDPHWHQPTDVFTTFSDKDFRLGLNAAQTTLAAVSVLASATISSCRASPESCRVVR